MDKNKKEKLIPIVYEDVIDVQVIDLTQIIGHEDFNFNPQGITEEKLLN